MYLEIIITVILAATAIFIFIKSIRKKSEAKCDCSSCSSHCNTCKIYSTKK